MPDPRCSSMTSETPSEKAFGPESPLLLGPMPNEIFSPSEKNYGYFFAMTILETTS